MADLNTQSKQVTTYFKGAIPLLLMEDLAANNGMFSDSMIEAGVKAFQLIQEHSREYQPQEICGVGTAAFRKAQNGEAFLNEISRRFGIDISLVNQETEAAIGFLAATEELATSEGAADVPDHNSILVWDVGNGSFQITAIKKNDGGYYDYSAPLGNHTSLAQLLEIQEKPPTGSPFPISLEDILKLVKEISSHLPPVPEWLLEKTVNPSTKLVTINGDHTVFGAFATLAGKTVSYGPQEVWQQLVRLSDLSEEEIAVLSNNIEPHKVIPKLALLYSILRLLKISPSFSVTPSGNTLGIIRYDALWKIHE